MFLSEQIRDKRLHPASREKRGRVVFRHERRARDYRVSPLCIKIQIFFTNFTESHESYNRTLSMPSCPASVYSHREPVELCQSFMKIICLILPDFHIGRKKSSRIGV